MTSYDASIARARLNATIREFLDEQGYLEVETPSFAATPIAEAHIDLFETTYNAGPGSGRRDTALFLLPSPEYYLKRLLAQGAGSVYEISRAFRNAESVGSLHNPEFTMLEFYTVGATGDDSIAITTSLLGHVGVTDPPLTMTMQEAWQTYADIDLASCCPVDIDDPQQTREACLRLTAAIGNRAVNALNSTPSWDELFQIAFLTFVEPALPRDRPLFLTRYPSAIPSLATQITGTPWADRWELYVGGIEIANCYGEETNPDRIASFQKRELERKKAEGRNCHPVDRSFLQGPARLPQCSGVAIGLDRLMMQIVDQQEIADVILFPFFGTMPGPGTGLNTEEG